MANVTITNLTSGTTLVGTELFESVQSATSVKLTSDQIKTFTSSAPTLLVETANTNTPATAATLSHQTSGTATAGIGTRLDFQCETAASNNEIGAVLSAVTTNVGSGTEAFNLQVLLLRLRQLLPLTATAILVSLAIRLTFLCLEQLPCRATQELLATFVGTHSISTSALQPILGNVWRSQHGKRSQVW
jgi:hypothetical protein